MTDRPILFSAPMVRALLAGTKTQTRRVLKPQPHEWKAMVIDILPPCQDDDGNWGQVETVWSRSLIPGMCEPDHEEWHPIRHHRVGDRLWVRETWAQIKGADGVKHDGRCVYRADARDNSGARWPSITPGDPDREVLWRPSIFMPRWASRFTLHVADVRVQRLQDISEEDAIAEGCPGRLGPNPGFPDEWDPSPVEEYRDLWNSINAERGYHWDANPWVAAYTFTVELCNIDQARAAA